MPITLITGANKGLGYEAARRLIAEGHKVYVGARDATRGKKAASDLGAEFVQIDVSQDASVQKAVAEIEKREGHLDVLINNAGISGGYLKPEEVTAETMIQTYETNVFGIVRTTHAFLPLLRKSKAPVIVNVSSGLGSFATVHDPKTIEFTVHNLHYNSSKSAVNMLTVQYAKSLPEIRINCVDPGYTATDLNHNSGPQTVTEGTDAIVKMAMIGKDGPTGTYMSRHGALGW
jgi:NAD(P)-dependent dehydrogenase (short-subunit alcohol dehydrogenase family)